MRVGFPSTLQSACDAAHGETGIHLDRRLLNWGVFLLAFGGIALAIRAGVLPANVHWFDLWPVILVVIGLGLLLNATPLAALGGALVALTLGIVIGGAVAGGVALGCDAGGRAFSTASGTLSGRASVALELGCGDLEVTTAPGSAWSISGTSLDGAPPSIDSAPDRLDVRTGGGGGFFGSDRGGTIAVQLPIDPSLDLSTTVNAGSAILRLGGTHVAALSLTVNAGNATVDLAETTPSTFGATVNAGSLKVSMPSASMSGDVTVNAGSLRMCVPGGVGLRIETGGGVLGGYDFGRAGLVQSGSVWQSPGFDGAENRISLRATANAGNITLNPAEGCA